MVILVLEEHVVEPGVSVTEHVAAALVDLAISRWNNPATDLSYFLFMSTTPQLRRTHIDEFLGHYHDCFTRCLYKLGEDPTIYSYR